MADEQDGARLASGTRPLHSVQAGPVRIDEVSPGRIEAMYPRAMLDHLCTNHGEAHFPVEKLWLSCVTRRTPCQRGAPTHPCLPPHQQSVTAEPPSAAPQLKNKLQDHYSGLDEAHTI